ncbi:hypothetical protein L1049_028504 [Liquidambar formosana]|uniref:PX domain-containing protein n=1 Tax=Liquidambar formosana TaxID=63359 RepID=A0AAP0RKN9_LIQFO
MSNGEGTRENSPQVVSPDPLDEFTPWQEQKLDGDGGDASPASSRYSSCGESEFDRYCSANSVMGTPSMRSSFGTFNECIESEFGSLRSLGLGEDAVLENFSLGGGFDRNYETQKLSSLDSLDFLGHRRIEFREVKSDEEPGMKNGYKLDSNEESSALREATQGVSSDMMSLKVESESELLRVVDLKTDLDEGVDGGDKERTAWRGDGQAGGILSPAQNATIQVTTDADTIEGNSFSDRVDNGSHFLSWAEEGSPSLLFNEEGESWSQGLNSQSDSLFDGREMGRLSEEEGTSSRYEHSEDEDSMFDYGTDNEHKIDPHSKRNMQYHRKEKTVCGNPLLMNSDVAFGSEDWNDFEQETGESTLASVMFNKFEEQQQMDLESERLVPNSSSATVGEFQGIGGSDRGEDGGDIHIASDQVQGANELTEYIESCSVTQIGVSNFGEQERGEDVRDILVASSQVRSADESAEGQSCSVKNIFETEQDPQNPKDPLRMGLNAMDGGMERERQYIISEKVIGLDDNQILDGQELGKSKLDLDPLSDITIIQHCSSSTEVPEAEKAKFLDDQKPNSLQSMFENDTTEILNDSPVSVEFFKDHPTSIKMENLDLNESYADVVHEMEEILLDSGESPGTSLTQGSRIFQSHISLPLRDGGSTASTSGSDDAHSVIQHPPRIDGVEVVGAKQKKGDVSLGERLVGVKEYTVYRIRVWSGKDQWEVERRYRDFFTLYRRLKTLFSDQGWILPSPWSCVERESRKIFGNVSPDVIAERSALIQECLRSILHSRFSSSPPSALVLFLSPENALPGSPASNTLLPQFTSLTRGAETEVSPLGKTISLLVEIRPYKSTKQLLEAQHYTCAGCHRHFDGGKTLMQDFVQTIGWGKPRLCEYTGQLFCSSCHTNDTAVLPARVLHHWDFTQYPVSQMAKSYLDSIHDQPMLCVSAVNPFLFSKVPALLHVMNVRKKIGSMLSYVHCPFHRSINKGLGSRRYLLESNDFFALRDLIDLSKGAFAALPVMIETVLRKILDHITERCLICCDVGVPCGARQACNDPSSLIFPFQESEAERCGSCKSVFHKPCFRKLTNCPCGAHLRVDEAVETSKRVGRWVGGGEEEGALDLLGRKLSSGLPVGFFSGLFSKARQEKIGGHKDGDTVILMGSLPSTSL